MEHSLDAKQSYLSTHRATPRRYSFLFFNSRSRKNFRSILSQDTLPKSCSCDYHSHYNSCIPLHWIIRSSYLICSYLYWSAHCSMGCEKKSCNGCFITSHHAFLFSDVKTTSFKGPTKSSISQSCFLAKKTAATSNMIFLSLAICSI